MTATRWGHTATLLPSGKVLTAGGFDNSEGSLVSALASAELYDPSAGTFTATGGMAVARAGHAVMLLSNGKVLIAGVSGNASEDILASAELYE
jgi:hypothetical protein